MDKGLTHMLDPLSGEFESEQIGSFFSFAKATDEFGVSLIGEARMATRISIHDMNRIKLCEIFDSELKPEGQACDVSLTTEISGWKELTFT